MGLKRYYNFIDNFISFSLYKVIDAIIPLLLIPHFLKIVGTENYGIYAFAFSLILYLIHVLSYGFTLSAVREISVNRDDKVEVNNIYNRVFTTQFYLFLFVLLILLFLVLIVEQFRVNYIVYLFFIPMLLGILLTQTWFFLGIEKMKFITIVNLVSKIVFVSLALLLVRKDSDFIYISLFQSIGYMISGIAAQIIIVNRFKIKFKLSPLIDVIQTLKESLSSFLTLITPAIYTNSAIFIIGFYSSTQDVSYMQIGTKVSLAFCMLNTIMTNVFYPMLNRKRYLFSRIKYVFLCFGLLFSISMYFSAEFLIDFWIPKDNENIVETVKYLSPSPFLSSVISIFGINGLLVHNKDKLFMYIIAVGSIGGLLFAFILIPKYSYIGGSISILTALTIKSVLSWYYYSIKLKS